VTQTKRPAGFDHIHRLLGKPMRAADQSTWPARPHLGGPLPVLPNAAQLAVMLAIAGVLRQLATPDEIDAYDKLVALAQRVADGEQLKQKLLQDVTKTSKKDSPAIKVAKSAARTALGYLYAAPSARNMVGVNVENAGITGVRALADDDKIAALLASIDQAIMRAELLGALTERELVPTAEIACIVSRPKGTQKGLALVMALLADGRYGLYVKLKSRWEWHEGDRATVFATVPDAFMRAVAADIDPDFKRSRAT
jgi:hypothetical protein